MDRNTDESGENNERFEVHREEQSNPKNVRVQYRHLLSAEITELYSWRFIYFVDNRGSSVLVIDLER